MPTYDDDLRLAHVVADQVDALTLDRFRSADLRVETKPDLTPVSDADLRAEELVRSQLKRTRPRDAVLGEEMETTGHGPRRWVIERTFAWFGRCRRLSKDFEQTIASAEAWLTLASIRLLSRRLATLENNAPV